MVVIFKKREHVEEKNDISNIILNSTEAIFAIDFDGMVIFWNSCCERLFGYTKEECLGQFIPIISPASFYELEAVTEKAKQGLITIFKTQKHAKDGSVLDIVITTYPLHIEENITGLIALVQSSTLLKNATFMPYNLSPFVRESKRTFYELRNEIVITLAKGRMTINQIALDSGINWKTVEKHLTYLIGKKLVEEIFSSEYIRVFELTEKGKEGVEELRKEGLSRFVKKEEK